MRPRSWARDVTRAQAQRGDVSRTCLRAKPAGHGRDKRVQRVIIAWSKLLREWPWSSGAGNTDVAVDTDADFVVADEDHFWPVAMTKMMMMVMLVSG